MLLVSVFTGFISLYLNAWYTGKTLNYTYWKQLKDIAPSYLTAFTIAFAVFFLKYLALPYYVVLVLQIFVGVVTGVVVSEFSSLRNILK